MHRLSSSLPCLLLALVLAVPAAADETDRSLSPYFLVEGGDPSLDALPLLGTEVQVRIAGVIAEVTVRQSYSNDGSRPVHATYVFPASTRAAVEGLVMTIGNRRVRAEIREKRQARREYEEAKSEGRNAALLEEDRPNVFRMALANLMPGERVTVELRYTELLVPTDGVYELVYPTVVGPRFGGESPASPNPTGGVAYLGEGEPPRSGFALEGSVSAGLPIAEAWSPSHELAIDWPRPERFVFRLDEPSGQAADRDVVLRYRLAGDAVQAGLLLHGDEKGGHFLLTLQPPRRVEADEIPPREQVFVVDVSGSMHGFPLDTAKSLMRELLGELRPSDRFNVLFFAGGSRLLAPRSLPATPGNLERALAMLEDQDGGGGTELLQALERALALPQDGAVSRSFVVITDGYVSVEAGCFDLVRDNLGEANVFAFGIGSSVNRWLIEGLARAGLGEPFVVTDPLHAAETVARFRDYASSPVLTDLRLEVHGFEVFDLQPAALPDLLAERPIVVQGRWLGPVEGSFSVSGISGRGSWQRTVLASEGLLSEDHAALRSLWARSRIADLTDRLGSEPELQAVITRLGLEHSLLTRFTSFLAIDEIVVNPGGEGEEVAVPVPLPKGVTARALGRGSEPELLALLAGLLLLLVLREALSRRGLA